jgi:peptidoglycan/xylan/chitin deacetylase (PgdA/CDA1 family)
MRRYEALVVVVAWLLLAASARAADAPAVDACATYNDVLGLSRIVEIDTANGPHFGHSQRTGEFDFLRDHEVVLTFDDGPLRPYTSAVLKALDDHCTKATFFMVGRMAVSDPAMVREVAKHGHTIGTHTWSHAKLQALELDKAKTEVELGLSGVSRALQAPVAPFFRFPYLRPSGASADYLKSRNVGSFAIDVDSRDFETKDPATVKATVMAQLEKRGRGILLFHDIQPSTAHGLKDILDALKAQGFKVVHMVPKAPAATLADYDAKADHEIAQRKLAVAKQPLAARALVWPQTDAGKPAAPAAVKKTNAAADETELPKIEKPVQP